MRRLPPVIPSIMVATWTAISLSTAAMAADWPAFRGNLLNHGTTEQTLRDQATATPRQVLKVTTGGLIWGTAVVDGDGMVYVGAADKVFYAIRPDGSVRWTYRIFDRADSLIDSAAALHPAGLVIVPGGDGFLHALDKNSGELKWTFKAHHASDDSHMAGGVVNSFEGNVKTGPDGTIYAGCDNGWFYAINPDGTERWSFRTGMMIWSSPAISPDNSWLAFGSLDGNLYVLDPVSGRELARFKAGADIKSSPAATADGRLFFGSSDMNIYGVKLDRKTDGSYRLSRLWTYKTAGEVYSSPALAGDRIVIGSLDGKVHALDLDGNLLWTYVTNAPVAASPIASADGVVVFGAKNGKLYALDLASGQRLWSYKANDGWLKTNLDASVAVGADRRLWVGSYGGVVYGVPAEVCAADQASTRCEQGGAEDTPDFGGPVNADTATLRYESRDGSLHLAPETPVAAGQMLRLRLVVLEGGDYLAEAAVSPTALSVSLSPADANPEAIIASDGRYLNILPGTLLRPDTEYTLTVSGRYFISKNWLADRVRLGDRGDFAATITFRTKPVEAAPFAAFLDASGTATWAIGAMYLYQPQALETYTPAALDGQGFLMTAFAHDPATGRFLMLGQPAFPRSEAGATPMPEPSKVMVLNSEAGAGSFRGEGAFRIAAMGGDITFDRVAFAAELPGTTSGQLANGEFTAIASCLKINGSGANYQFPNGLIHTVCDPWMRLVGVGKFEQIPAAPAAPVKAAFGGLRAGQGGTLLAGISGLTGADPLKSRLLTLVQFDPESTRLTEVQAAAVDTAGTLAAGGVATVKVGLKSWRKYWHRGDMIAVFYDRHLIATVPVTAVAE